ncbi:hypothetical protein [Pseudoxanthomonas winnipegensis]|uniref:hypothetical protein n=1 Tax=Pseudoxanthomonas winnipegensis TaxID=2480810 RepID=UPI0013EF4BE7|nr:hypothetical protein [Pseudoxanthomonas winnipegensis]
MVNLQWAEWDCPSIWTNQISVKQKAPMSGAFFIDKYPSFVWMNISNTKGGSMSYELRKLYRQNLFLSFLIGLVRLILVGLVTFFFAACFPFLSYAFVGIGSIVGYLVCCQFIKETEDHKDTFKSERSAHLLSRPQDK